MVLIFTKIKLRNIVFVKRSCFKTYFFPIFAVTITHSTKSMLLDELLHGYGAREETARILTHMQSMPDGMALLKRACMKELSDVDMPEESSRCDSEKDSHIYSCDDDFVPSPVDNGSDEELRFDLGQSKRIKLSSAIIRANCSYKKKSKNFPCTLCEKRFCTRDKMIEHALRHSQEKRIACPDCFLKFISPHMRNQHYSKYHHSSIKTYPQYQDLHIQEKALIFKALGINPIDNAAVAPWIIRKQKVAQVFICNFDPTTCLRRFKQRNKLIDHLVRHVKSMMFVCPLCIKKFNCPHDRNVHVKHIHHERIRNYPNIKDQDKAVYSQLIKPSMYVTQQNT